MRFVRTFLLIAWMPVVLAGCSDIFEVENPGVIAAADLDDAAFLNALLEVARAAGQENLDDFIMTGGMAGNDFTEPTTCADNIHLDMGYVDVVPGEGDGLYNSLGASQWVAREALRRIRELVPNPDTHPAVGRGYYWDAFLLVNRADMFQQITFDAGPPHTPVEVYEMAIERLGEAITVLQAAGGHAHYVAAAYGTMARAQRQLFFETKDASHLANAAQSAAQALATQSDFRLEAIYGAPGQENGIWSAAGPSSRGSSLVCEGPGMFHYNRMDPISGERDPRVPHREIFGNGPRGPKYVTLKYPEGNSPIPVSRWQEASLIVAEHRLHTGDLAGAVAAINQVRAAANLPAFQSADPAGIREQLIFERQSEFWLEGRDFPDLRAYGIVPIEWNEDNRAKGVNQRFPISRREVDANENL